MSPRGLLPTLAVVALLGAGVYVRLAGLTNAKMWIDEAESGLNALSILERGYPAASFAGLPMYENSLVDRDSDDPEYELSDPSYSSKGVAVWHQWLPLYSIAGSLAAFGVDPADWGAAGWDEEAAIRRRVFAARLPAVLFTLIFLVAMWRLGLEMGGAGAGLTALALAALSVDIVDYGQQARYYAPTLAFTALAGLFFWRWAERGRRGDAIGAGVALSLLFHSHILSAFVVAAAAALLLPKLVRRPGWPTQLVLASGIFALAAVPWVLLTGYFEALGQIPSVWPQIEWPEDVVRYVRTRKAAALLFFLPLVALAVAGALHRAPIFRWSERLWSRRFALLFLAGWVVVAVVCLVTLMPAPAFYLRRVSLLGAVPGMVAGAVALAALLEGFSPRFGGWASAAAVVALLGLSGRLALPTPPRAGRYDPPLLELRDYLRSLDLPSNTRIYAEPNLHLRLQFLLGVRAQSIAPIRKEFLDSYPGPILLLLRSWQVSPANMPAAEQIGRLAREAGVALSRDEAEAWRQRLTTRVLREELDEQVAELDPLLAEIPSWLAPRVAALRQEQLAAERAFQDMRRTEFPFVRHSPLERPQDHWLLYKYAYAGLSDRLARGLNYQERFQDGRATLLPSAGFIALWDETPVVPEPTGSR